MLSPALPCASLRQSGRLSPYYLASDEASMTQVLLNTEIAEPGSAPPPVPSFLLPPLGLVGGIIVVLVGSFLRQRQLLDQGGPTIDFIWLALLGALAGGVLAFGAPNGLDLRPWASTA